MIEPEVTIKQVANGFLLTIISGRFYHEAYTSEIYATFEAVIKRLGEIFK